MSEESITQIVKAKYGQAALRVATGGSSCCGSAPARSECDPITSNLYEAGETADLPAQAVAASLGCGNPTALAELRRGRSEERRVGKECSARWRGDDQGRKIN